MQNPYKTLEKAVSVAPSGSIIRLIASDNPTTYKPASTITIDKSLTIQKSETSPSGNKCIIDFNFTANYFNIDSGSLKYITLSNITIQNVNGNYAICGDYNCNMTIDNCVIQNNSGTCGIGNWSNCTIKSSTYGGGICNFGTCTINATTVSGNQTSRDGGGISNAGPDSICNIYSSNITVNSTSKGGGIWNGGTCNIYSTNITSNTAINGGGIFNDSRTTILYANPPSGYNTVKNNTSTYDIYCSRGIVTIENPVWDIGSKNF